MKIVKFPNRILASKSKPVEAVKDEERVLIDNMIETMYLNQGVGLAAPQVGIPKRIIVVDVGEGPMELINPAIIKREGLEAGEEGCLSIPGAMVKIKRAKKILYRALTKYAKTVEAEASDLLARAIQHEIDHLDGRLIIDYLNPVKRFFLKRRLEKNNPAI